MTKMLQLFTATSINPESKVFRLESQTTFAAVGLGEDDFITFEIIHLSDAERVPPCPCWLSDLYPLVDIDGIEPLVCPTCESVTEQVVRLTPRNRTVILDAPQGAYVRAVFHGDGLGTARVWATFGTTTQDLTDSMRGCPPVCCEDEEQTWERTSAIMCVGEEVMWEERSNCGNLRWVEGEPVEWVDTGEERCGPMTLAGNAVTFTKTVRQTNQCNDVRWEELTGQTFAAQPTGEFTCQDTETDTYTITAEFVDSCGGTARFTLSPAQAAALLSVTAGWVDTGETRCTGFARVSTGATFTQDKAQTNLCGRTRWVAVPGTQTASATGEFVSVNPAGAGPWPDDYDFRIQFQDSCGNTVWYQYSSTEARTIGVISGPLWQATGELRCDADQLTTEQEEIGLSGQTRWVDGPAQTWTSTGEIRCEVVNAGVTPPTYRADAQEANQCGHTRWVAGVTAPMTPTGETRPDPQNPGGLQDRYVTPCGQEVWRPSTATQSWVATGFERCFGGVVQMQEATQSGFVRWTDTARPCVSPEYFATLPLPCGGLAFRPSDTRDPAATVTLESDCEAPTIVGYLYPTPREGATTPVTEGCDGACPDDIVLGYAVDAPSEGAGGAGCKFPPRIVVENSRPRAVQFIDDSCATGANTGRVLWDDGSITRYTGA